MKIIIFLLLCTRSCSYKNIFSKYSSTYLHALREPNNKKFEDMDNFEKFEKFSEEQNSIMQNEYLYRIYNQLNNVTTHVSVLDINFKNIVETMDNNMVENVLKHIPKRPETQEEIIDDSFEGFLKGEFENIPKKHKNFIDFDEYYIWRQTAGLVLTEEEVYFYYSIVVGENQLCNIMQFITINHLIDESDFPIS